MGLDMYLTKRIYIADYPHDPAGQEIASAIKAVLGIKETNQGTVEVNVPAAYWRKANAIHGWFVDNVQGGEDDCEPYEVHVDQLVELRNLCAGVLDGTRSKEELKPRGGFFFGSVDDNDAYEEDLRDTIKQIDAALKLKVPDGTLACFEYLSSW